MFLEDERLGPDLIPFICCATAYGEAGYKRRAMDAGMNKFLTKPISSDDLVDLLT